MQLFILEAMEVGFAIWGRSAKVTMYKEVNTVCTLVFVAYACSADKWCSSHLADRLMPVGRGICVP
jgi:hypothetical protein